MIDEHQLVSIFCEIDDFCKELDKNMPQPLLTSPAKGRRGPACSLSISEIMTIQIVFQMVGYRNFKTFYTSFLQIYWKQYSPKSPSYQRFIELISFALLPLTLFTQFKSGKKTGIYYIDGSCLPERKNMKEQMILSGYEKQLLNQRNLIETVFDCLKHKYHVWHTRHRSISNAMTHLIHLMAALAAYTIEPLKLSAFKLLEQQSLAIAQG